jgi:hypothetical protein
MNELLQLLNTLSAKQTFHERALTEDEVLCYTAGLQYATMIFKRANENGLNDSTEECTDADIDHESDGSDNQFG